MEGVVIMNPDFWNGRKVFLTGHTGFKGSWLSLLLSDWGAEVHGYALEAVEESLFRMAPSGMSWPRRRSPTSATPKP